MTPRKRGKLDKRGPKFKYDPKIHLPVAIMGARFGLGPTEISKSLGIGRTTLCMWRRRYPKLRNALAETRESADANVEKSLYQRAIGYKTKEVTIEIEPSEVADGTIKREVRRKIVTKHVAPDVDAIFKWLKNRKPKIWRDKQIYEISGLEGEPIKVDDIRGAVRGILADPAQLELAQSLADRLSLPPPDAKPSSN